jgi:hypothetical protein
MILTQGYEIPMYVCASLAVVHITELHKTVELSNLGLTTVKYNIKKLQRKEWAG